MRCQLQTLCTGGGQQTDKQTMRMKKMLLFVSVILVLTVHAQDKSYPVLFQQTAAEYRALCYQAYNLAQLRIDQIPRKTLRKEKLAIITDLDETILDNSYSEAQLIKEGKQYTPASWKEWMSRSATTAVPGSVEFLQAAARKGITIFYISNRDIADVPSTLIDLQHLQFPNADTAHMIFKGKESTKEPRRLQVAENYKVIMLMGDNLTDFMNVFEKKTIAERFAETDKVKEEWGRKFIVLPNAIYGEWENAIYGYKNNLTPAEKEAAIKKALTGFK
jgi:5'-nucleotidase (lipoprotein e(P4) family)